MLRRAIACAALLSPLAVAIIVQGCGDTPLPEDICNWLKDSNNCYSRLANDIGSVCGYDYVAGNDPLASATGFFQDRDDLTQCILDQGGQVILDPPPTFDMFPLETVSFSALDFFGVECGVFTMANQASFSVTINGVDATDAGTITNPDGSALTDDITGGTFSVTTTPTTDQIDVSCPGGNETHNFDTNLLSKCAEVAPLQPFAIVESSPGSPETPSSAGLAGYIRFRVQYPPVDPAAANAQPRVVEYFNCSIPAPPPPCQDGTQNGDETDVDCGGSCATKCAEGLKCLVDADCLGANCGLNAGLKQCLP
jgi:hypothetical protein